MKERRHHNNHGLQGTKSGSRKRRLKRLARELRIPFGSPQSPGGEHG